MRVLTQVLLVALGSSLGGLARWGVGLAAGRLFGTAFPVGTLIINLTGSLFLGWFTAALAERLPNTENWRIHPDDLRLMVAVGFTGAYTTFSTFEYESDKLIRDENYLAAATYIAVSVFLGLIAVRVGAKLATLI